MQKITDFGAFMALPGGFEALLHISELANYRVCSCSTATHAAFSSAAMQIAMQQCPHMTGVV